MTTTRVCKEQTETFVNGMSDFLSSWWRTTRLSTVDHAYWPTHIDLTHVYLQHCRWGPIAHTQASQQSDRLDRSLLIYIVCFASPPPAALSVAQMFWLFKNFRTAYMTRSNGKAGYWMSQYFHLFKYYWFQGDIYSPDTNSSKINCYFISVSRDKY
jgi:hypothetical protein